MIDIEQHNENRIRCTQSVPIYRQHIEHDNVIVKSAESLAISCRKF